MIDHEYVLSLADTRTAQLAFAGGKGASLARLFAAGLPVPDAFVIATAAYQRFVRDNELEPSLLAVLHPANVSQPNTLETASRAIGELIAQAQMPEAVSDAVRRAYAELDGTDQPVAVRSSATAEDLPGMSFAGQQETYLNVSGAGPVLDAVRRCWASLWTARAIGYRLKKGVDQRSVSMPASRTRPDVKAVA